MGPPPRPPALGQPARQVEVGVGVIGSHFERAAVPADGAGEVAEVLGQRPEIVGRLVGRRIGRQRSAVTLPRLVVVAHAVMEEPQVVPACGARRVDGHHLLVGRDRGLPLLRVLIQLSRASEPDVGAERGRNEGAYHPADEARARLPLPGRRTGRGRGGGDPPRPPAWPAPAPPPPPPPPPPLGRPPPRGSGSPRP